jgi:hypothetical protein
MTKVPGEGGSVRAARKPGRKRPSYRLRGKVSTSLADFHSYDALVSPFDNFALSQREIEGPVGAD